MAEYYRGNKPVNTITVLLTLKSVIKAWNTEASCKIIKNCDKETLEDKENKQVFFKKTFYKKFEKVLIG